MAVQPPKRQLVKAVTLSRVYFVVAAAFTWSTYQALADIKSVYQIVEKSLFMTSKVGSEAHEFLLISSCVPNNNDPDGQTCKTQ